MNRTFGILFYIKRSKIDNTGKAPVYLRITIDGARAELAIKRTVEPDRWSSESGKVKGTTEEARSLNAYIDIMRSKVYEHHKQLVENNVIKRTSRMYEHNIGHL